MRSLRREGARQLRMATWLLAVCLCGSSISIFAADHSGSILSWASQHAASSSSQAQSEGEEGGLKGTLFKWVNFLILFGGLAYFLRKPFRQFFEARRAEIQKALAESKAAKENAERELAAVMQKLAQIEQEVASLKREAATQADADRKRVLETAANEADQIIAAAHEEVARLVKSARQELREHAAALVVEMAEQKIKSEIDPEQQSLLIKKFIGTLQESDRPK